jgi:pimeloyl-ACP methyl ester carboxylesterase
VLLIDAEGLPAARRGGSPSPAPVRLTTDERELDDLARRLKATRWLGQEPGWERGADIEYLRDLARYWADGFDWQARQQRLNALPNFAARVGSNTVHFLHARSPHGAALPLVIAHGWPSAPAEFAGILGALTDPAAHGAAAADSFHVVVVSLPGFLLSDRPTPGSYDIRDAAETVAELMSMLGYERYGAHGGDWGATVATWLSHLVPRSVVGLHLTTVRAPEPSGGSAPLRSEERVDPADRRRLRTEEMAYQALQATKPDALAVGLGDSPAGLATWLVDKYRSWSDCGGDVERAFDRDLILELCTLYWLSGTIGSSMRIYFNTRRSGRLPLSQGPISVPTGCAIFAHDLTRPTRAWAEPYYQIERWQTFPNGGHFPALETPHQLVEEIRAFFRNLR